MRNDGTRIDFRVADSPFVAGLFFTNRAGDEGVVSVNDDLDTYSLRWDLNGVYNYSTGIDAISRDFKVAAFRNRHNSPQSVEIRHISDFAEVGKPRCASIGPDGSQAPCPNVTQVMTALDQTGVAAVGWEEPLDINIGPPVFVHWVQNEDSRFLTDFLSEHGLALDLPKKYTPLGARMTPDGHTIIGWYSVAAAPTHRCFLATWQ